MVGRKRGLETRISAVTRLLSSARTRISRTVPPFESKVAISSLRRLSETGIVAATSLPAKSGKPSRCCRCRRSRSAELIQSESQGRRCAGEESQAHIRRPEQERQSPGQGSSTSKQPSRQVVLLTDRRLGDRHVGNTMRQSQADFIRQQGFVIQDRLDGLYPALMFQPRVIGAIVAYGIARQSPWAFLMLSTVVWWSALVPTQNPFDAFLRRVIVNSRRLRALSVAPPPRRFAQGTAATLAMAIGVARLSRASGAAWLLEGMFAGALIAVIFGRFCVGSHLYHRIWSRSRASCAPLSERPCGDARTVNRTVTRAV
jgi:Domain of unknown function (DUF4395)